MTTAVASPPSFQSIASLGWNGGSTTSGGFSAMTSEEPSRMFMPQRKTVTRSSSSSSLASNSSSSSTGTVIQTDPNTTSNPDSGNSIPKKKQTRGGFWPVSKAESTSGVTNARASGAVQSANSSLSNGLVGKNGIQPAVPIQNHGGMNGARSTNGQVGPTEQTAILALLPMNGTFERKQINVPFFPDILKIGRQTNAKTVPTPLNGFFDSKVLSRQHAEIWAERNGKIWIRDVKSSNGTFVNGQRLSPESRESEPHELRQHDTLELGIDIVSEDQKTIVHHKVSAKVEFAGLPGTSNNVLDLNFGDLDPSHGGSLLASPMSAPMMQSRSRPGGPPNGRISASSSVAGSQMSSIAQQRQANFWGTPLNVEQLVKHLSTEMRAAKQQAQDLDHANTFLNALITTDGSPSKLHPPLGESNHPRLPNGRVKAPRIDHAARFGDPPAPPPQQPLPEKPDSAKSSPINSTPLSNLLKRSETAKVANTSEIDKDKEQSPTSTQSSQILSLVEALNIAKKEIDSQGARVKQLEDMLKQEKTAREAAEERARRVEEMVSARPVQKLMATETPDDDEQTAEVPIAIDEGTIIEGPEQSLQQRIEHMVAEMQRMKSDMEKATMRAETAEQDASGARASLADMIERFKKENEAAAEAEILRGRSSTGTTLKNEDSGQDIDDTVSRTKESPAYANGHIRTPSRLPQHLERAMATVLRENHSPGDMTAQTAPYVSMLGVVLIGVGLMAYLNSWQKGDK